MFLEEGTNGMPVTRWRDLSGDTGEVWDFLKTEVEATETERPNPVPGRSAISLTMR
jgi:hypothetical protein